MVPTVVISGRGAERARGGHPWIYSTDVTEVAAEGGDIVRVVGPKDRVLGHAMFSDRSKIALRWLTRDDTPPSEALWHERVARAIAYRDTLSIDATAYRLVHGESDLLPGLVVDRYGDYLVVQTLAQATDRRLGMLCDVLVACCQPKGILARNDPRVRALEGLPTAVEVVYGQVPELVSVIEAGVRYEADLIHGQKTGLFLDQRENRIAARQYAKGQALDCFSYNGGFALALAPVCTSVIAVDISEPAADRTTRNAAANGFANVRVETGNVFDFLRDLERAGERFDMVVLDPPAFAKSRDSVPKATSGYKEINLRALRLLEPGGVLVTCSCSHHVDDLTFAEVIHSAAMDANCQVAVVEQRTQARDHPVLLGVPETHYLKCLILRKLP